MRYTAAQKKLLLESDAETRNYERAMFNQGGPDSILRLAHSYLRSGNPNIEELIDPLWEIDDPTAREIQKIWAQQNQVPSADDFNSMIHQNYANVESRVDEDEFEDAPQELLDQQVEAAISVISQTVDAISNQAKQYHFKLVEEDESGRSGVWHSVEVYASPAGGFFWVYMHHWGSGAMFNYGTIEEDDLTDAMSDSLIDYFAEMSW